VEAVHQQSGGEVQVGTELGSFRLVQEIGRGAMASIFRAQHTHHGHQLAIKVLHPDVCRRAEAVRRFAREVQAVNRTWHPNILEITDVVISDNHPPFLTMELLQGEDLQAKLDRAGALAVPQAVNVMAQVCGALAAVHQRNVVHRDLKPGNIFLVGGGDEEFPIVKVLDFGLAKFMYEEDPFLRTRTGATIGTPEYMPPEQIRGDKVDYRIDLYAVGAILYELVTGKPPFHGGTTFDLVQRTLKEIPEAPSRRAPASARGAISPLLDQIILRCLEKDPDHRIQSAAELQRLLEASLDDATEVQLPPLPQATPSRWPWVVGAAAAATLLGLALWRLLL
jgi:serine/threonine-protein kinase